MPAWLSGIVKLIIGVLIDKFRMPILRWIKDWIAKRKKATKSDKAAKEVEDAETKDDFVDAIDRNRY